MGIMNVTLNAEAEKFIEAQIKAGHFHSPDALVQEAVSRMIAEADLELDDETAAAINRAEEQLERGEGMTFDQFVAELRRRLATK
jgi:Arc/MetJ-type ribon-helix-helix transcriptional regulator